MKIKRAKCVLSSLFFSLALDFMAKNVDDAYVRRLRLLGWRIMESCCMRF